MSGIKRLLLASAAPLGAFLYAPEGEGGAEPPRAPKPEDRANVSMPDDAGTTTAQVDTKQPKAEGEGGEEAGDGAAEGEEQGDAEEGAADGDTEGTPEPLPDYDDANEEVKKAYEERYVTADGTINEAAFALEADKQEDGSFKLKPNHYAFLKAQMGASEQMVDNYIAGQAVLQANATTKFYESFGGEDGFKAAGMWAAANYTDAQKAKYAAALEKGGEAFLEQAELLRLRYSAANPKAAPEPSGAEDKTPARKPLSPQRTTGKGGTGTQTPNPQPPVGKPFANNDEYLAELRKANRLVKTGKDLNAVANVERRLERSTFWKK